MFEEEEEVVSSFDLDHEAVCNANRNGKGISVDSSDRAFNDLKSTSLRVLVFKIKFFWLRWKKWHHSNEFSE